MIEVNKLAEKVIPEMNDIGKFCPICHRQVTQHIITLNWKNISVCSCGWTSNETPAVVSHRPKFFKTIQKSDKEQTINLVATFPSKDKHRGRKMFKDHTSCFFTTPNSIQV